MALENSSNINYSRVSRPFVITAVISVFIGSSIGSLWMMSLAGISLPNMQNAFQLHKVFQVNGFLTLLIMGIGYMIVPRFRNIQIPSIKLAGVSFILVISSIALSVAEQLLQPSLFMLQSGATFLPSDLLRLAGLAIFSGMVLWTLRIRPKLLKTADYFIGLSVVTLLAASIVQFAGLATANPLSLVQIWLLFPIMMIFGIEYKTLPSFMGFIRPRRIFGTISFSLLATSVIVGFASSLVDYGSAQSGIVFNLGLLSSAIAFAVSHYVFGGFDNTEILRFISGEKKARYFYTMGYTRLSFLLLYAGILFSVLFNLSEGRIAFVFYDLAIHTTAIGFLGVTIALYLPLMLPPVIGRSIQFTNFNRLPVILIVSSLTLRGLGHAGSITGSFPEVASYFAAASGWIVLAAIFAFVIMIHRSMTTVDLGAKNR